MLLKEVGKLREEKRALQQLVVHFKHPEYRNSFLMS